MKKILLLAAAVAAIGALSSCTIGETATVVLTNTSRHTITTVNFWAIYGGTPDYNSVSIAPDESEWFYAIEPGTYRIDVAVDDGGAFVFDPEFTVAAHTVYPRLFRDSDIP